MGDSKVAEKSATGQQKPQDTAREEPVSAHRLKPQYRKSGHPHIGVVLQRDGHQGVVDGWLPANESGVFDEALERNVAVWHVSYDDGDSEEVEDYEIVVQGGLRVSCCSTKGVGHKSSELHGLLFRSERSKCVVFANGSDVPLTLTGFESKARNAQKRPRTTIQVKAIHPYWEDQCLGTFMDSKFWDFIPFYIESDKLDDESTDDKAAGEKRDRTKKCTHNSSRKRECRDKTSSDMATDASDAQQQAADESYEVSNQHDSNGISISTASNSTMEPFREDLVTTLVLSCGPNPSDWSTTKPTMAAITSSPFYKRWTAAGLDERCLRKYIYRVKDDHIRAAAAAAAAGTKPAGARCLPTSVAAAATAAAAGRSPPARAGGGKSSSASPAAAIGVKAERSPPPPSDTNGGGGGGEGADGGNSSPGAGCEAARDMWETDDGVVVKAMAAVQSARAREVINCDQESQLVQALYSGGRLLLVARAYAGADPARFVELGLSCLAAAAAAAAAAVPAENAVNFAAAVALPGSDGTAVPVNGGAAAAHEAAAAEAAAAAAVDQVPAATGPVNGSGQ